MQTWLEPQEIVPSEALLQAVGGHPLVAQTLARRGFTQPEPALPFLDPDRYVPARPAELPGLDRAADRIEAAIKYKERICVWGDFDVDGQTSTTLLVAALRELGADVFFHIPVRESESHGVNLPNLQRVIDKGARVILTCDTGIAAHDAANYAQSVDVDLVVTDHHDLPDSLPAAYAVTNPKLLPAAHPLATLPGVGVAYKLAEELYRRAGCPQAAHQHDDLAALGIVADLALLTGDTRYLLQRGLQQLRHSRRTGLQMMLDLAGFTTTWLAEDHIAFVLAPRLNALGRLSDANSVVEFLTTTDPDRAQLLASQLEALNARRKLLTDQVFQGAMAQIERDPTLAEQGAIVLSNPAWPAGVIGIVASRLVERFNRPVVLLASPPRSPARGSARSVEGCNITAAIATQASLLNGYGGHPMAAGLSLEADRIPEFRGGLSRAVEQMLGERVTQPSLAVDAYLPLSELRLDLAEEIERLAPFGPGNPALTLVSTGLVLKSSTNLGRGNEHLQLIVEDEGGTTQKVLWWQGAGWPLPEGRFDLAYHMRASSYQGVRQVQIEWVDFRPAAGGAIDVEVRPALQVFDYRRHPQPLVALKELLDSQEALVWREGEAARRLEELHIPGVSRTGLRPARHLVIWTTPTSPAELMAAMEAVSPEVVHLFAVDPEAATLETFLKRLAGLVKAGLASGATPASVPLQELAAATAQTTAAVRKGLAWLADRGHLSLISEMEGEVLVGPGAVGMQRKDPAIAAQLNALLEETAAYRAYFRSGQKERVMEVLDRE